MSTYTRWRIREFSITSLQLDPQNPRIPPTDKAPAQADLIAELVEHDDVYDLARKIALQGFYPTETLVGIREKGTVYIIEGNRRLAAMKLLLNPDLAPDRHAARFKRLQETQATKATKVRVAVAPSRDSAAPLLMSRHTGSEIEKWSPPMQARFYENLWNRGMTLAELATAYGGSETDVLRFLRTAKLYRMARSLDLPDDIRIKVDDPREFPVTNLTRLTETEVVQKFLGLKPDPQNIFRVTLDRDEFRKGLRKLVVDVAQEKITSRSHNTTKEIEEYLTTFGDDRPNDSKKSEATADEIIGQSVASHPPPKPKAVANTRAKSKSILPSDCRCTLGVERINDVFREIKRLRVVKFPNSSAIMLRSLLEMAITHYFDATGHTKKLKDKIDKSGKSPRPANWHPSLDQMLKYVIEVSEIPINPNGRKALQKLVSTKNNALTLESMNGFVHNQYTTPTESELRALVGMLQPTLELVLVEPATPSI